MEIHLSGGSWLESRMLHKHDGMGMGVGENEWHVWETSEGKVRDVRQFVDAVWSEYASSADLV
jgi:copper homeostasis protein